MKCPSCDWNPGGGFGRASSYQSVENCPEAVRVYRKPLVSP